MAKSLSDLILMCDVDGTILFRNEYIPPRTFAALERFTAAGGKFGLATGRGKIYARPVYDRLPVNLPCVLLNGAMIYDFAEETVLYTETLTTKTSVYVEELMRQFPEMGALLVDGDEYIAVSLPGDGVRRSRSRESFPFSDALLSDVQDRSWSKGLFLVSEKQMESFLTFTRRQNYPGIRFVQSDSVIVEMLHEKTNKGRAIEALLQLRGYQATNLVAAGDFNNDIEMLQLAGLGVTFAEAAPEVQQAADRVLGSAEEGAIADLIASLEADFQ